MEHPHDQVGQVDPNELATLFHALNNQLGIILAHAELIESKAIDDQGRARARHVVSGVMGALSTVRSIRTLLAKPV